MNDPNYFTSLLKEIETEPHDWDYDRDGFWVSEDDKRKIEKGEIDKAINEVNKLSKEQLEWLFKRRKR